jgi:voltage-gated potassium channel
MGRHDHRAARWNGHSVSGSAEALGRFERQTAWPMLILALAIVPMLVVPLVLDLSPTAETLLFWGDWLIWAAFAAEYTIRLYLAPAKEPSRHQQ